MGSSPGSYNKTLFGAVALLIFIGLLLIGMVEFDGQSRKYATRTTATITTQSPGYLMNKEVMIGKASVVMARPRLNFSYMMSKRRVPNGPDPIHNRRAGKSKQPPGKA